jgi:hypothetical protein
MPQLLPESNNRLAYSFDLHVHARAQVQLHQGVHGLLGGLQDIQKPLMGADLELLPAFLVDMRLRSTQNLLMRVGRGMGPATLAPVRRAVSTISAADWSSSL